MAFFGLTALGPQNTFEAALTNKSMLHIFEESDFKQAFDQIRGDAECLRADDIPELLNVVYHGPPPSPAEHTLLLDRLERKDVITWPVLRDACRRIRDEPPAVAASTATETGPNIGDAATTKTTTTPGCANVSARPSVPLTAGQEIGWNVHLAEKRPEIRGRRSCPETVYANELAKSEVIY